jgi:hypothetical protein
MFEEMEERAVGLEIREIEIFTSKRPCEREMR